MRYLKTFAMTLPFLLAGLGALLMATMMAVEPEPERLPFAYVQQIDVLDSNYDTYDLQVMDALSGDILFKANSPELDCPQSMSPDGQWLVYSTSNNFEGNRADWIFDLSTGEAASFLSLGSFINWESDTVGYLVESEGEEFTYIRRNLITGDSERLLTLSSPNFPEIMRWIGGEAVYVIEDNEQVTIHRDNENSEALLLPEGFYGRLSMSSNTRYISFDTTESSSESEFQILDTQTSEVITNINTRWLSWKPDTNEVGYINADRDIVIYDASTQDMNVFEIPTNPVGYTLFFRWSLSGRYAAYNIYYEGEHLDFYILDTITGESHMIVRYVSVWVGSMRWISETLLLYAYADADYVPTGDGFRPANADLWLYDAATGETRQLTNTPDINEDFSCAWG